MVKRTVKTALLVAADGQSPEAVSAITNTEGAPSAGSVAPVAGPDPAEGASSSTIVEASASEVQTTESGKVADAGVTVAAPATDPTVEPEKMIRITSRRDGFRRAGLRHGKEPRDYPVSDFTDEQLALLEDEPNLTVEYL